MRLRGFPSGECPKIAPLAGFRIFLPRVEPVFSGGQFANHVHLTRYQRFRYNVVASADALIRRFFGLKLLSQGFTWISVLFVGLSPSLLKV
jgi:hypothetical protein